MIMVAQGSLSANSSNALLTTFGQFVMSQNSVQIEKCINSI